MVNKNKKIIIYGTILFSIIGCGILPIDKSYIFSRDVGDNECFICNGEGMKTQNCRDKKSKQEMCITCERTGQVRCLK